MADKTYRWRITLEETLLNRYLRYFAKYFGWTPTIVVDGVEVPNPTNPKDVVNAKLLEHFIDVAKAYEIKLAGDTSRETRRQEVDLETQVFTSEGDLL